MNTVYLKGFNEITDKIWRMKNYVVVSLEKIGNGLPKI